MNVTVLEDWIRQMGLPLGVESHFTPVRSLLSWLQVRCYRTFFDLQWNDGLLQTLSSITEFSHLVSTIQNTRGLNPLQVGSVN